MKALKRVFGSSKAGEDTISEVPVMEVETASTIRAPSEPEPIYVKSMELRSLVDVQEVADELRNGNIMILDISTLMNQDQEELKRAIDQIRGISQAIGGNIGRLTESKVIATPRFVNIQFRKA
ncbi:MAG: hypothetical protein DRN83_00225 [Hadesarchaea archaeon]|mgnify:CR=1 FL=1|nr:MAG: hypothetical protein DRN83_00225 [Hadesarchaea archaeon]HDI12885.1 cell division protein SepF [Hadesarchaea archaeon]